MDYLGMALLGLIVGLGIGLMITVVVRRRDKRRRWLRKRMDMPSTTYDMCGTPT